VTKDEEEDQGGRRNYRYKHADAEAGAALFFFLKGTDIRLYNLCSIANNSDLLKICIS
jgi:hypothetical protein